MARLAIEEPEREEYALRTLLIGPVVRVSDLLIGNPQDLIDAVEDKPVAPAVELPARRRINRLRLSLDWYDLGVVGLIVTSAAAALVALLTRG